MSLKRIGKFICVLALAGAAVAVPMLTGCNTGHPEAKITIEFSDKEYVLEYKMYRNMYPQTVQHFIELADNGFYDNTIVHNKQSSYMYCGGYNYVENDTLSYKSAYEEGEDGLRDYLDATSKETEYATLADPTAGKITPSVYRDFIDGKCVNPLNTLIGEFSGNQHKIDNGALKASFGALRMYYSPKNTVSTKVYLDKKGSAAGVMGDYSYNSATSLFSIQTSTSTSSDSSYCIFATIKNDSVLTDLRKAISGGAVREVKLYVDNRDELVGSNVNEATYTVNKTPIVIKSVKITKY